MLDDQMLMRKLLFTPADTQQQLHDWIEFFLGIDLPDCTVDPESTSNPMALLYEMYSRARVGDDEDFQRVLGYAARDAFKTLVSSIFEVLCLFHLRRSACHLAAVLPQAQKAQSYVKKYFRRAPLNDFITTQNERRVEVTSYTDSGTGDIYTLREWEELDPELQKRCALEQSYIQIIVATMAGTNSEHTPILVADELDLCPVGPYQEAQMIPSVGPNGELPLTFLTSSRKFSIGLVQKEIDNSAESGLNVRHWNIIDCTKPCPPTRHKPDEPKVALWIEPGDPKRIVQNEDVEKLDPKDKSKLVKREGYAGCKTCPLFAACQGRLATEQKSTSKLLKPIPHVINQFRSISTEVAAAQLMCWKPSSEGMIWPKLNRERHMKTAAQIAELITGEPYPETVSKSELIQLFKSMNIPAVAGLDHGFSHAFAVVTGFLDGHKMYVIDSICSPGLELLERIELCDQRIKHLNPTIWPDQAYPADNKTFKRHGYSMMKFTKDVAAGIEAVRMRLEPGADREPTLFFLAGDEGCEALFKSISGYHYKIDTAGNPTEIPDTTDDDSADALRYLCQNNPIHKGTIIVSGDPSPNETQPMLDTNGPGIYTQENFLRRKIEELTQGADPGLAVAGEMIQSSKGRFFFST